MLIHAVDEGAVEIENKRSLLTHNWLDHAISVTTGGRQIDGLRPERAPAIAVVKKHLFTLFRARFTVDVPGPDDLEAKGNFLEHEYSFERAGRQVARVSKKWFRLADTYAVDIDEGEDNMLILASAVVIDLVSHRDDKKD